MQKSSTFVLPSIVQKRGTYSKQSSPSSAKLSLSATQDVWLANLAENRCTKKAVSEIDWLQNWRLLPVAVSTGKITRAALKEFENAGLK